MMFSDLCGTPGYLAPETLKCNMFEGAAGYSQEVDMWVFIELLPWNANWNSISFSWACGVIMFTLLVGCPPFWHRKQMIMLRNIMEGKYSFMSPEWSDISGKSRWVSWFYGSLQLFNILEDPKDLIRKCLVVDPEKRITVRECLKHPFFNTVVSFPPLTRVLINFSFPSFIIFFIFILTSQTKENKVSKTSQHYLSFNLKIFRLHFFVFTLKFQDTRRLIWIVAFVKQMQVEREICNHLPGLFFVQLCISTLHKIPSKFH